MHQVQEPDMQYTHSGTKVVCPLVLMDSVEGVNFNNDQKHVASTLVLVMIDFSFLLHFITKKDINS